MELLQIVLAFALLIVGTGFTVRACCALGVSPQTPVIVYVMNVVPAPTAVTTPVDALTVATVVLLLLHAPVPPAKITPLAE